MTPAQQLLVIAPTARTVLLHPDLGDQLVGVVLEAEGGVEQHRWTGAGVGEHLAVECLHRGATDYFVHGRAGEVGAFDAPTFRDTVRGLACALHDLGVKTDDRVAILSDNRPEWTMSDFAILAVPLARVSAAPLALAWNRHR